MDRTVHLGAVQVRVLVVEVQWQTAPPGVGDGVAAVRRPEACGVSATVAVAQAIGVAVARRRQKPLTNPPVT